jgi:hypothetical protein
MLTASTIDIIRKQVAWRFGCDPADLRGSRTVVVPHGPRFAGYYGIQVWVMEDAAVISAPAEWVQATQAAATGQTAEALRDPARWSSVLGARIERIVGPSYQGYVDPEAFRPAPLPAADGPEPVVRRLGPADAPTLERLAASCLAQEWIDSAIQPDHIPIFAMEQAGELLAAASAPEDGPGVASVGVITHPTWRGRGYGAAVASALTADHLAAGSILHYQTLRANTASVAIASALGYRDLATAVGIRLRA